MPLTKYTNPKVKLHTPLKGVLLLDSNFAARFDNMVEYAYTLGVTFLVIDGIRYVGKAMAGTVAKPAKRSCHFIGCAVDVNFWYQGKLYNNALLEDHTKIPAAILQVIAYWKQLGYRWGGDFKPEDDEVHFDDGTNVLHPAIYDDLYQQYQKAA